MTILTVTHKHIFILLKKYRQSKNKLKSTYYYAEKKSSSEVKCI